MSLTLPVVIARLRRELSAAESAFDSALLTSSTVQQTIILARADLDVPVHAGQEALLRLQRAQAQLISAQNDLFRAHDDLARLGVKMTGEEDYTPPSGLSSSEPDLRNAA